MESECIPDTDFQSWRHVQHQPFVFLAGDWVGAEGMLADASAASATAAADAALACLTARPIRSLAHVRA